MVCLLLFDGFCAAVCWFVCCSSSVCVLQYDVFVYCGSSVFVLQFVGLCAEVCCVNSSRFYH